MIILQEKQNNNTSQLLVSDICTYKDKNALKKQNMYNILL